MNLIQRMFEEPINFTVMVRDLGVEGKRMLRVNCSFRPATQAREIVFDMEVERRFFNDAPPSETQARIIEARERALLACLQKAYPSDKARPAWWKFWSRA